MPRPLLRGLNTALIALAAASFVNAACAAHAETAPAPQLGLMGTIPIYWGEADDLGGWLSGRGHRHWARGVLESRWRLVPLDRLDGGALNARGADGLGQLLLAQPRGLSASENVALDTWVRAGGHLLLFADPMLTGPSRFAIGDRRRPQDVILLSPILGHWGLTLQFADDQPAGADLREIAGTPIPVNLPGRFVLHAEGAGCTLEAAGLLASCTIGQGKVLVLADAAVLDIGPENGPVDATAAAALLALAERAFPETRETAGTILPVGGQVYEKKQLSLQYAGPEQHPEGLKPPP
jgi:hypothetical protein